MGVLFENSIVCHVFYAIVGALAGPVWVWLVCFVLFLVLLVPACLGGCGLGLEIVSLTFVLFGEFDPGSGRTLAACLTHASRTGPLFFGGGLSGERVSIT